ncbi:hypothetical protein K469DRAFT_687205 [Zopfia rhizophila CBS 207.26]|uniref:Uncharacterized protein n=1 Tax=Zopfia rhizophila CBS 207.26 TaxID=1314779 RepID=A0A6A6E2Q1_9PEZI|nr:hypothetical protein K469DRAFT_687205 [Zopfia rhizophila CBS 207.26]
MSYYGATVAQNGHHHQDSDEEEALLHKPNADGHEYTHEGTASAFAAFGVIWTIVALQAFIRWVVSPTEFRPAPLLDPDHIETWRLVCLRIFEALSVSVLAVHLWFCVLVPLFPVLKHFRKTEERGRFSLDGRHVVGGLLAVFADGFLNCYQYIFMWNAHSINLGVWAKFLPFHNHEASSRYAESLLWGPPMYIYFCAGFGIIGCGFASHIRNQFPHLTNAGVFTIVWVIEFILDFIIENLAIRITHGYGFAKTYGPLTLFPGKVYQFPIYESVFVASLGCVFTAMRLKAYGSPHGLSPIEKGYWNWPRRIQGLVRTFAIIGFCAAAVLMFYHLPLNWLGIIGDCHANMPSYMKAG